MENIIETCGQKKMYLQSYSSLTMSVKIIKELIGFLIIEQKENATVITKSTKLNKINLEAEKLVTILADLLVEKNNLLIIIFNEINQMDSEIEKNILMLKYIKGYTFEQICEYLNYSLRQVYNIHNNALRHFKN